jgi:hypothetical protein
MVGFALRRASNSPSAEAARREAKSDAQRGLEGGDAGALSAVKTA